MAVIKMEKVLVVSLKERLEEVLNFLQQEGAMHIENISETTSEIKEETHHDLELKLAQVEFALDYLKKYVPKKKGLEAMVQGETISLKEKEVQEVIANFDFKALVERLQEINDNLLEIENKKKSLQEELDQLKPWKKLSINLSDEVETEYTKYTLGTVPSSEYESCKQGLIQAGNDISLQEVSQGSKGISILLIYAKYLESDIKPVLQKFKFTPANLPKLDLAIPELLNQKEIDLKELERNKVDLELEIKEKAGKLSELKVIYDYLTWQKDKRDAKDSILGYDFSYSIVGWVRSGDFIELEKKIEKIGEGDVELMKLETTEEDKVPVEIKNGNLVSPFESITNIYGLPLPNEVDPTPWLASFFVIFFGMCLSDAGYGLVMAGAMFLIIKFAGIPRENQGLFRLLFYGGIATFFMGILFGGWFGLEPSQAPSFLVNEAGNAFKFQILNPMTDPLTVMVVAFAMGVVHVWFGILVKGYGLWKNGQKLDAILDSGLWLYFLPAFIFFALANTVESLAAYAVIAKWMVLSGVVALVLTQGRKKRNILVKFFSGVLSLYDLVGYGSDVLSYSRLLALGLSTGVIGLAMNKIAFIIYDLIPIPVVNILIMAAILIAGHLMNLALSALGSYIHSGRLQFVEFFGKFLEGGGRDFKPLKKRNKYLRIS